MAVRDFLLDDRGDRVVVDGDWGLAADRQAVVQGIRFRVRFVAGDDWLNEDTGLPWFTVMLGKTARPLVSQSFIRRAISSTPDVVRVSSVGLTRDSQTRQATASFNVVDAFSAEAQPGQVTFP